MPSNNIEQVCSELTDFYHKQDNRLLKYHIVRHLERPYSKITFLRVQLRTGVQILVVKTILHHPVNKVFTDAANQAVVEYSILSHLSPLFLHVDKCHVPVPILVIPELETYVMEFAAGDLLMDKFKFSRYFSSRKEYSKLKENMCLCGKWLKNFQQFTGVEQSDLKVFDPIIDRIRHRLGLLEQHWREIPVGFVQTIMALLEEKLNYLETTSIFICGRHGDFTPYNMISGNNGLTVIDFLGYDKEPQYIDIFKMLVFFEYEAATFSSSRQRVKEFRNAFLEGYGLLPEGTEEELVICETMQRIVSIWAQLSQSKDWYHKLESRNRIKNHIAWLMDRDRRSLLR